MLKILIKNFSNYTKTLFKSFRQIFLQNVVFAFLIKQKNEQSIIETRSFNGKRNALKKRIVKMAFVTLECQAKNEQRLFETIWFYWLSGINIKHVKKK
jgi:hypothetical protein